MIAESEQHHTRKKFAEALEKQIQERLNEREKKKLAERSEYIIKEKIEQPSTMCQHGKNYRCFRCKRIYPKKYHNKKPLQYPNN